MSCRAKKVGKDVIDDVPRIPVNIAPADTIATVDARIEDVISFGVQKILHDLQRGFLVNNDIVLIYRVV